MSRQVVKVFDIKKPTHKVSEVPIPDVFLVPIRSDIVSRTFSDLNKNRRQAYAVNQKAGMMYNAESWGPGRAVARVPRVSGSGTHANGQGAFANSCRGGRMFNPTTVWRRLHRKVNLNQRRHAVASALAASAVPSLVLSRGHRIRNVAEIPLVLNNLQISSTKELLKILKALGLQEELDAVNDSKKIRPGKGKARGRKYKLKRGPLIIYDSASVNVVKAARNIPGVETCNVDRLNLLQLAPGGHLGRLILWTENSVKRLNELFGTATSCSTLKKNYILERPIMKNANLAGIINSDDIQSVVKKAEKNVLLHERQKKNPLTNRTKMNFLNPYDKIRREQAVKDHENFSKNKKKTQQSRLERRKLHRKGARQFIIKYHKELEGANKKTIKDYQDYIFSTKIGKAAIRAEEESEK